MTTAYVVEILSILTVIAVFFAPRFSPNVRLFCFIFCIGGAIKWGFGALIFILTNDLFMSLWMTAFAAGAILAARRYARFGLRAARSQTEAA